MEAELLEMHQRSNNIIFCHLNKPLLLAERISQNAE